MSMQVSLRSYFAKPLVLAKLGACTCMFDACTS